MGATVLRLAEGRIRVGTLQAGKRERTVFQVAIQEMVKLRVKITLVEMLMEGELIAQEDWQSLTTD